MYSRSMKTMAWTKTTAKGLVLTVDFSGAAPVATVDGKAVAFSIRYLDTPRTVGVVTVVAQVGPIGLSRPELDALTLAWRGPPPPPVDAKYEHAKPYTREDAAWDRGFERKHHGEE